MAHRIYVGSYTNEIYTVSFNPDAPSLTLESSVTAGFQPSWITPLPADPSVVFAGLEQADGQIVTVKYDQKGQGTIVGSASSGGADPCSLVVAGDELIVSNYSAGSVSVIPLSTDASHLNASRTTKLQFTGTGPNRERQEQSHPHQVIVHPDRQELLVPDLGSDKTWRLTKDESGSWSRKGYVEYKPGSGPRHVAFHDGILYTLLELTNEVSAHRFPPLPAEPTLIATAPTMSKYPAKRADLELTAAEILVPTPNASFPTPYLYVSNRNDPSPEGDMIAIYSIADPAKIELVAEVRSGLKHLRGMVFGGPQDKYLVAGGAHGGGLKVFERIGGGKGLKEVVALALEAPTGFLWA